MHEDLIKINIELSIPEHKSFYYLQHKLNRFLNKLCINITNIRTKKYIFNTKF